MFNKEIDSSTGLGRNDFIFHRTLFMVLVYRIIYMGITIIIIFLTHFVYNNGPQVFKISLGGPPNPSFPGFIPVYLLTKFSGSTLEAMIHFIQYKKKTKPNIFFYVIILQGC